MAVRLIKDTPFWNTCFFAIEKIFRTTFLFLFSTIHWIPISWSLLLRHTVFFKKATIFKHMLWRNWKNTLSLLKTPWISLGLCLGVKPMILSNNISKKNSIKKNFKNILSPGFKAFSKIGKTPWISLGLCLGVKPMILSNNISKKKLNQKKF